MDKTARLPDKDRMRWRLPAFVLSVFAAAPAVAQEASLDRYEMDAAAGRVLFQTIPIAQSIVDDRPAPPPVPRVVAAVPDETGRRRIRVVYPGPYGR